MHNEGISAQSVKDDCFILQKGFKQAQKINNEPLFDGFQEITKKVTGNNDNIWNSETIDKLSEITDLQQYSDMYDTD